MSYEGPSAASMSHPGQPKTGGSDLASYELLLLDAKAARRPFEGQWFLNVAMYLGYQWIKFDGNRLHQPDLGDVSLPVDNRLRPIVRTRIAKATKTRPVFTSTPATADDDALEVAELAEEVFEDKWRDLKLTRKQRKVLWWRDLCGKGFWKFSWDKTIGPEVEVYVDAEGVPLLDSNKRPIRPGDPGMQQAIGMLSQQPGYQPPAVQGVNMGELCVTVPSTFGIYVDPLATDEGLSSCDYLIEELIDQPDRLKKMYPQFADRIVPDSYPSRGQLQERLPQLDRRMAGRQTGTLVKELWARPCARWPDGRHCVWACNTILLDEDNPYPWLPYSEFDGDPSGDFWPDAPVTPLISPQVRLNKRAAQIDENADRFGNPAFLYPEGMDLPDGFTGAAGEHLQYPIVGDGTRPGYLEAPNMPAYVINERDYAVDSLREISGQHEVTGASVPAGVTAASAINLLQEQDDTQMGPDIEDMEIGLCDAGNKILWICARYYSDERFVRIAGEDGDWNIRAFRGSQLSKAVNRLDVEAGSGLPRSTAGKNAQIGATLDMLLKYGGPAGITMSARNVRRMISMMDVGGLEMAFEDIDRDERKVRRENRRMLLGEQIVVNEYDNHPAELESHNDFRKTARFDRAAKSDPGFLARYNEHIAAHEQAMFDKAVKDGRTQRAVQDAVMPPPPPPSLTQPPPPPGGPPDIQPQAPPAAPQ